MPPGRLVFEQAIGEAGSLFTMNTDGSDTKPLPAGASPRWSPDGTRISIVGASPQGLVFVGVVDADGTHYVQFDSPDATLELGCFAWSPDGERLVCEGFDGTDVTRNGLYTVRASDGGDLVRLTTSPDGGHDIPTDYSPDGRQIAFIRQRLPDEADITAMVADANGTGAHAISDQRIGSGRWSPDGDVLLSDAHGSLQLLSPAGGSPRAIDLDASAVSLAFGGAWSPDGSWIVFSGKSSTGVDIFVVRPDGSGLARVLDTPTTWEGEVSWAPSQP
jgi:Tol biopolymer transport system component